MSENYQIIEQMNSLINLERFSEINSLLDSLDLSQLPSELIYSWLNGASWCASKLVNFNDFADRCRAELAKHLGIDKAIELTKNCCNGTCEDARNQLHTWGIV